LHVFLIFAAKITFFPQFRPFFQKSALRVCFLDKSRKFSTIAYFPSGFIALFPNFAMDYMPIFAVEFYITIRISIK